jgi:CBS domain-containing protein
VGVLVVLSDDLKEDIVGIVTERDIIKNIELINRGAFWKSPVRTVMTATVRTITIAEIQQAPKLMARHHIRHLPVVVLEKDRKRLVGVISMRDVFRFVMEEFDFDLGRVYQLAVPKLENKKKRSKKVLAAFSSDPAVSAILDQGAKLTHHLIVRATPLREEVENLPGIFERFDAVFIDLDDLKRPELAKVLAAIRSADRGESVFLAFSPAKIDSITTQELAKVSSKKRIQLLAKPLALGLLYEKFLRGF